jgi:hypothetical protein
LYAALFVEANRDYVAKDGLINKVAELTGKSEELEAGRLTVLCKGSGETNRMESQGPLPVLRRLRLSWLASASPVSG